MIAPQPSARRPKAGLAHLVLSLPIGGTERLVERMVRQPPEGFRAACLCLDSLGELGEDLRADGFTLEVLNRRPGRDWRVPLRIAAFCRREGITVLHCHQYTPWFYGILTRLLNPKVQVIFTEHGRFHPDISSPARRAFNRVFSRITYRITAVSEAVQKALVEIDAFPPAKIEVLLNGVACPRPSSPKALLRETLGLRSDAVYLVLCARFDPIKWIEGLVEAFALVAKNWPQARLLLVGDGPLKPQLQAQVAGLGLKDFIAMPGFVRNVPDYLAAADIFVLCSHSEGTSVSLMEAMAMALPAVLTRVGGNPKVAVENETALLVPPRDAAALAQALATLIGDAEARERLGAKSRQRYLACFRPEIMNEKYGALYGKALGFKP